jgi:HEAT repeat protein
VTSSPDVLLAAREGTGAGFPAAVREHLRERGGAGTLADARAWAASGAPLVRLAALELLGALCGPGAGEPPDEAVAELLAQAGRAAGDPDDDLRWVAAKVLGQAGSRAAGEEALRLLVGLATDAAGDVRWQAVSSLPLVAGSPPPDDVLAVLLRAASPAEDDEEVRDQAVFALALQLDVDTQPVRDLLAERTSDAREDTAAQAARGLALRGDGRALVVLEQRLAVEDAEAVAELDLAWAEAAADLADARLLPALRALRAHPEVAVDVAEALDEAIARSGG